MTHKIDVLDHGFVKLIDYMGSDQRILQAARVSTGSHPSKGAKQDCGLIRYLYKNKHTSPFEKVVFEFHIKLPIFVARQWMRHRTQSYNEFSGRYSEFYFQPYIPDSWREQGEKNHQGSGRELPVEEQRWIKDNYEAQMKASQSLYNEMVEHGVSREMARFVIPVSQYTEFYTTIDLWNLFHFLHLRLHEHAQYEIRVYAEAILSILENLNNLKWSVEIFKEVNALERLFQEAIGKDVKLNKLAQHLKDYIEE
jgi:thymidylate synthase (FAD)